MPRQAYVPEMTNQFRYSRTSFQRSVVTAIGLTLIVSFLVWLFSRLFGFQNANLITVVSGLIFFSFCSAAMIRRYALQEIVLAIRPDGLFDARYSSQAIPWDHIKDVRLGRTENEFKLSVYLWPDQHSDNLNPALDIELAPLDASVENILQSLSAYKPVAMEQS